MVLRRRAVLLALAAPALCVRAQAAEDKRDFQALVGCGGIKLNSDRLNCYDARVLALQSDVASENDAQKKETYEWTAGGTRQLPPIKCSGPWVMHWRCSASIELEINKLELISEKDGLYQRLTPFDSANSDASGDGSTYEQSDGVFCIRVTSLEGTWTVRVEPA